MAVLGGNCSHWGKRIAAKSAAKPVLRVRTLRLKAKRARFFLRKLRVGTEREFTNFLKQTRPNTVSSAMWTSTMREVVAALKSCKQKAAQKLTCMRIPEAEENITK